MDIEDCIYYGAAVLLCIVYVGCHVYLLRNHGGPVDD